MRTYCRASKELVTRVWRRSEQRMRGRRGKRTHESPHTYLRWQLFIDARNEVWYARDRCDELEGDEVACCMHPRVRTRRALQPDLHCV